MKTVQETFRELDDDTLIKAYLNKFPISIKPYKKSAYDDLTIGEYKKLVMKDLKQYLHRLRTLPTKKSDDGKTWIFFAERSVDGDYTDFEESLVNAEELREKGADAPSYAYEYTDQAEVLGYYVANNIHTQRHLDDLLAEIMNELDFFGYEQENLPKAKKRLDDAVAESKAGNVKSFESVDDFLKKYDNDFDVDEYTDEEEKLKSAEIKASIKRITYSKQLEVDQILKDLDKSNDAS